MNETGPADMTPSSDKASQTVAPVQITSPTDKHKYYPLLDALNRMYLVSLSNAARR
jgi:hypothetical protein